MIHPPAKQQGVPFMEKEGICFLPMIWFVILQGNEKKSLFFSNAVIFAPLKTI
jgi:hypothetical protein